MTYEHFHNMTIGELLSAQATRFPNRTFLRLDGERLSYADVELRACSLAAGLRGLGLQPGDRLGVILPNTPAHVVTIFAAAKAGLILVPINVRRDRSDILARLAKTKPKALVTFSDPKRFNGADHLEMVTGTREDLPELRHLISDILARLAKTKPKALVTFSDPKRFNGADHLEMVTGTREDLPELRHLISVTASRKSKKKDGVISWESLLDETAALTPPTARPSDAAAIIHTLGSSGEPRGATLTHSGLVHNAADIATPLDFTTT